SNMPFAKDAGVSHPDEIIGKTDFDLEWTHEQAERFRADDHQVIKTGLSKLLFEEPQTQSDHIIHWLRTNKVPVKDAQNQTIGVIGTYEDITERKQMQATIEKRILALTRPLEDVTKIAFDELFDLNEIQRIQDEFSAATGVASIITRPDGTPITQPSNFTRLCSELVQKSHKGCSKCFNADSLKGRSPSDGPSIQPCLGGGLLEAGVNVSVGDQHVANWFIGQVRNPDHTHDAVRAFAHDIGIDETEFLTAYLQIPAISYEHFQQIAQALFTLATQLSTSAYQNIQQARFIAAEMKTAAELRESQEHLSAIWNVMDIGILLVDAETRIILKVNPELLRLSGYQETDLIGHICHKLICPAEVDNCPIGDLNQRVDHSRRILIHADGHAIMVEKTVKPITLKGRPVYLETVLDITERERADIALRRLSTAIHQSSETVLITDAQGLIQYVNPAFEAVTGYSSKEAIGQTPRILKSHQHSDAFYTNLWKTITAGHLWEGRFINKRKNGELYTEDVSISPVRDPAGTIIGYVAIKHDISEEILKEERFRQSQKMQAVGQLAGGIAHDFNNLLQAILGFSELLLLNMDEDSLEYRNVGEIQKAAHRAADLTHQLLAFSRKQPTNKQSIDLNSAILNARTLIQMTIGDSIQCQFKLDETLKPIHADLSQLSQILINLSINARDAMPSGGTLTFTTKNVTVKPEDTYANPSAQTGQFVCLSVADQGCGMSHYVKNHLFEPFFTTKGIGQGTGLGLSVVYGAVQQSHGWIQVESEEGQGTTFMIYLPLHESKDSGNHPTIKFKEKIVLVENDTEVQARIHSALETLGYPVLNASGFDEALALIESRDPNIALLISEIVLPEYNGIALANRLQETLPNLAVLLYGTLLTPHQQWHEIDLKGYQFLQKPFSMNQLLTKVKNTLQQK
ncbi:MAG: PAS domain S-box protein, partial [Kiritimatiellaceae bacterium]|nr:PAS domain S-box protein [Kiritimatiellaceae bacterium]